MIDPDNEPLISLAEAARTCPAVDGKRPHPSTVFRWIRDGFQGVKLEHVRVGRRICTTKAALTRFMNACAETVPLPNERPANRPPRPRTAKQAARAINASKARLIAAGVRIGE